MAAKSLNRATLIGHAGKDPEIRYTGSGAQVASFSVATNEYWKDKTSGQPQERTEWHNIVAFNRLAEIIGQYVKKGEKVFVEGRIQTRNYDKDGVKHYITEIVADDLILLGGNPATRGGSASAPRAEQSNYRAAASAAGAAPVPEYEPQEPAPVDDLPF
ncbi:MAG TPA: single-stranded DNA-binding protein [Candidatus Kapabacteria bacterium]|nr:single-stranded DNA-binding protein [Candidatus Kapabacteria bacterium]